MEYNEQTALRIIEQYQLSDMRAVWKTRGRIPKKYLQEDFQKRIPLDKKELRIERNLRDFLKTKMINLQALAEEAAIPIYSLHDTVRERSHLSRQELYAIRKALNNLRVDTKKAVNNLSDKKYFKKSDDEMLKEILERPIFIKIYLLDFPVEDYKRVIDWKLGKGPLADETKLEVVNRLAIFILMSSLD